MTKAGMVVDLLKVTAQGALKVSAGTVTALVLYVVYWGQLGRLQKRGQVPDMLNHAVPRQLFRAIALAELFIVYVAPLLAMLVAVGRRSPQVYGISSVLTLASVYFLPNMIMTAINIVLESIYRRRQHLLVNYSSTAVNNLWRLLAYVLVLLDEQRRRLHPSAMNTTAAVTVLESFRMVAWAGVVISVLIMIVFEPLAISMLTSRTGKDSAVDKIQRSG